MNLDIAQIASALNNLDSAYVNADVQKMLKDYLVLIKQEIEARMTADYSRDIKTVDDLEVLALKIADYLSAGIGSKTQ